MQLGSRVKGIPAVRVRATDVESPPLGIESGAPLSAACGHVLGDRTLLKRGYRPFASSGGDLPPFLIRRLVLPDGRRISVTVLAGVDPTTGDGALERSTTGEQIAVALRQRPACIFRVLLTVGNATIAWQELATSLARTDGPAYEAFVAELSALPMVARRACPVCRADRGRE